MIRNIVFDMGRVLLQFDPVHIASQFTETEEDAKLLAQNLFQGACWESMDRGTMTHAETEAIVRLTLPERLWDGLHTALAGSWYKYIPPVEGMDALIRRLKEKGYHLYVLTNANIQFHQYKHTLPGYDCFDDILVSADEVMMKPEPVIYRRLAEKFGIDLTESLFVDDRPINIAGGKFCGMDGVLFTDAAALEKELTARGIL